MAELNKNQAMIDFLLECPTIQEHPLFFNFSQVKEDNAQFVTQAVDKLLSHSYIDGSVMKRYQFTLIAYKSISYNPLVRLPGYSNENLDEFEEFKKVVDWISLQAEAHYYPDFGPDCMIDSMQASTEIPNLDGVDVSGAQSVAKYSVQINIDYMDYSKKLWN